MNPTILSIVAVRPPNMRLKLAGQSPAA